MDIFHGNISRGPLPRQRTTGSWLLPGEAEGAASRDAPSYWLSSAECQPWSHIHTDSKIDLAGGIHVCVQR